MGAIIADTFILAGALLLQGLSLIMAVVAGSNIAGRQAGAIPAKNRADAKTALVWMLVFAGASAALYLALAAGRGAA